jgi:hypothetical protein
MRVKIIGEETVVRYHVEYDEEETILLKIIGFLSPHAEPRARLWVTAAEIKDTEKLITTTKETRS